MRSCSMLKAEIAPPCTAQVCHHPFAPRSASPLFSGHCEGSKGKGRSKFRVGVANSSRCRMGLLVGARHGKDMAVMEEYFSDKVVWVTGASAGFGEALCVALCQAAKPGGLILSARRKDELERVRLRCLELLPDVKTEVLPLDLSDLSRLQPAAEQAKGLFGRVDVLVNNGGVGFRGLGQETSIETDQHVMNVDFFSGVILLKALLPDWLRRRSGHVVQISSVQGFFGLPGRTAYAAAKHAAVGFYDSLRAEVADNGIAVTTVCPGYIATEHARNAARSDGVHVEPEIKGVAPDQRWSLLLWMLERLACYAPSFPRFSSPSCGGRSCDSIRVSVPACQLVLEGEETPGFQTDSLPKLQQSMLNRGKSLLSLPLPIHKKTKKCGEFQSLGANAHPAHCTSPKWAC
eukprot:s254_g10.t1